jgi:hypothetical protein
MEKQKTKTKTENRKQKAESGVSYPAGFSSFGPFWETPERVPPPGEGVIAV